MSKLYSVSRCVLSIWLWFATTSHVSAQSVGFVLGQADAGGQGGSKYGYSWGLILLMVILGLMITLKSSGRKIEFRRGGTDHNAD